MNPKDAISRLTSAGLLVYVYGDTSPYPGGYRISKPASVLGNTKPEQYAYACEERIRDSYMRVFGMP